MFGVATVPLARAEQALAVPRDAVITKNGARLVLKVVGDTLQDTPVTEGLVSGANIQITQGLSAGDVILADARRTIAPGAKVNPIPAR
jgi:HlyD family secretion protein